MPKIDPITGCTVMTQAEFWASEAKREGKGRCGGDLMQDFYEEMAAEERAEEDRLKDPERAKEEFNREIQVTRESGQETLDWLKKRGEEPDPGEVTMANFPLVESVLEVLEAEYSGGFRGSKVSITARCLRSGGVEDVLEMAMEYFSGSRIDPPDQGGYIKWCGLGEEGICEY
jgi:predicted ribosome quality control (RQC) complex YloA/Tae2 family protein